jgi:radical SAM protein with 4Fe4S-binding SPASM domain
MGYLPDTIEQKIIAKRVPLDTTIELTHRCPMDCRMCYLHDIPRELSTDEWKNVLDQLAQEGCLFLLLTGGEPFLRKDLMEILDDATAKGFMVMLKTTGALMTPRAARAIKEYNVSEVHVSILGGTSAVHDALARREGAFERAVGAVRMLREAGARVKIKSVITKGHVDEVEKLFALCRSLGLKEDDITFDATIFPKCDGGQLPLQCRMGDDELRKFFHTLRAQHVPQFPFVPADEPLDDVAVSCHAGRTGVAIRPDGVVYPCVSLAVPLGNVKDQPLREILEGPANSRTIERIMLSRNADCARCPSRMGCFRCPALSLLETGSTERAAPENCRQTRIIQEVVYGLESMNFPPTKGREELLTEPFGGMHEKRKC